LCLMAASLGVIAAQAVSMISKRTAIRGSLHALIMEGTVSQRGEFVHRTWAIFLWLRHDLGNLLSYCPSPNALLWLRSVCGIGIRSLPQAHFHDGEPSRDRIFEDKLRNRLRRRVMVQDKAGLSRFL
jgi:hypothetical protein